MGSPRAIAERRLAPDGEEVVASHEFLFEAAVAAALCLVTGLYLCGLLQRTGQISHTLDTGPLALVLACGPLLILGMAGIALASPAWPRAGLRRACWLLALLFLLPWSTADELVVPAQDRERTLISGRQADLQPIVARPLDRAILTSAGSAAKTARHASRGGSHAVTPSAPARTEASRSAVTSGLEPSRDAVLPRLFQPRAPPIPA
jgi:hypothetical protein